VRTLLLVLWAIFLCGSASAQNFSCPFGKQGACLDYGDKVCSTFGKCVSDDAVCFDSFTCNFQGFVCKSKLEDVIDEHDTLVGDYNDLRRKYNGLLDSSRRLEADYDQLATRYRRTRSCVELADTLDEAQACVF
jgi:hypothetical protein